MQKTCSKAGCWAEEETLTNLQTRDIDIGKKKNCLTVNYLLGVLLGFLQITAQAMAMT